MVPDLCLATSWLHDLIFTYHFTKTLGRPSPSTPPTATIFSQETNYSRLFFSRQFAIQAEPHILECDNIDFVQLDRNVCIPCFDKDTQAAYFVVVHGFHLGLLGLNIQEY
jgi:hypothetical protein